MSAVTSRPLVPPPRTPRRNPIQRPTRVHVRPHLPEFICVYDSATIKTNMNTQCLLLNENARVHGSVFPKRSNFRNFMAVLPPSKINSFDIKMEDDCPTEADEARCCLLKTFGYRNVTTIPCVGCCDALTIFDQYPIIDGTFFLSSVKRSCIPEVSVIYGGRMFMIQALCVRCLYSKWICTVCGADDWCIGKKLTLGTLYTYDIISVGECSCPPRCSSCRSPINLNLTCLNQMKLGNHIFYHEEFECSWCHDFGFHLARNICDVFIASMSPSYANRVINQGNGSHYPMYHN